MEALWSKYIEYLKTWADDHKDAVFAGMSPECWDEWTDGYDEWRDEMEGER